MLARERSLVEFVKKVCEIAKGKAYCSRVAARSPAVWHSLDTGCTGLMEDRGVLGDIMPDDMGTFRVNLEIENPMQPGTWRIVEAVLVDTGAEVSWLPGEVLDSLGIGRRKQWRFRQADGTVLTRWSGGASVYLGDIWTADEVVFGEPGDLVLLGLAVARGPESPGGSDPETAGGRGAGTGSRSVLREGGQCLPACSIRFGTSPQRSTGPFWTAPDVRACAGPVWPNLNPMRRWPSWIGWSSRSGVETRAPASRWASRVRPTSGRCAGTS